MKTKPMDRWFAEIEPELRRQAGDDVVRWFASIMHKHCVFHERSRFIKRAIELVVIRAMVVEWFNGFVRTAEGRKCERFVFDAINGVMQTTVFSKEYTQYCDDIARLTWAAIGNNLDKFDANGPAKFSTFCVTIAKNTTRTFLRDLQRKLSPAKRGRPINGQENVRTVLHQEVSWDDVIEQSQPTRAPRGRSYPVLTAEQDAQLLDIYEDVAAFVEREPSSAIQVEYAFDIAKILKANPDPATAAKIILQLGLWPTP